MQSPTSSTVECCGESICSQQHEQDSQRPENRAGILLIPEDHHHHQVADSHLASAGMLTTNTRTSPPETIASNTPHACRNPPPHAVHHPSSSRLDSSASSGGQDVFDEEDLSDNEGGVFLEPVPSATRADTDVSSQPGGASTDDGYEASDDPRSTTSDLADMEADQDEASIDEAPDPYLDLNGPSNIALHLQALYGAAPTMATPHHPPAAWAGAADSLAQAPVVVESMSMSSWDDYADALPPVQLSNPNPTIPGSENLGLVDFLRNWAYQSGFAQASFVRPPHLHQVLDQAGTDVSEVRYSDLGGDECDFQALNWLAMETTRSAARLRRRQTYKNYVNRAGSDELTRHVDDAGIPSCQSFFRFRKMTIRQDVHLAHFQLRSVLACPSRTHAYYPSPVGVNRINTVSRQTDCVMSMRDFPAMGGAISTLDAGCGVLMGGTFNGDYCLKSLNCNDRTRFVEGQITSDFSGITNHIRLYRPRRSAGPVAAIASNDCGFRVMDVNTEHFISETTYPCAVNCSALSPDHRLRVVVGDCPNVFITNADTGEILQELTGHRDYGFACDWSEDGWTVATGFQDRGVKIWDARKWCNSSGVSTSICTIRSEMASVRGLRFSPVGSGHPVLVAAEETDFVNFIDAQTFSSKQTIDVFGEIGGVAFANDGQDVNILCCDTHRGGLMQVERCGRGPGSVRDSLRQRDSSRGRRVGEDEGGCFRSRWARSHGPALLDAHLEPF